MQITLNPTPIAVYQMGKVGSETIVTSLQKSKSIAPIYHVHILAHKNINIALNNYQQKQQPLTLQLENSKILREYLDRHDRPSLNIITAVREPISQFISAFFQNIEFSHPHLLDSQGNGRRDAIYNFLTNRLSNYKAGTAWNCNWFDNDFNPALGMDVYQYDFDRNIGYKKINFQNLNILILQLENSKLWNKYIADFLGLSNSFTLDKTNLSKDKKYYQIYQDVLQNIKIPIVVLEEIYRCKYCQHFYSKQAIESFIQRWSQQVNKI